MSKGVDYYGTGVRGRKTGLTANHDYEKDDDGFDDLDQFFEVANKSVPLATVESNKRKALAANNPKKKSSTSLKASPPKKQINQFLTQEISSNISKENGSFKSAARISPSKLASIDSSELGSASSSVIDDILSRKVSAEPRPKSNLTKPASQKTTVTEKSKGTARKKANQLTKPNSPQKDQRSVSFFLSSAENSVSEPVPFVLPEQQENPKSKPQASKKNRKGNQTNENVSIKVSHSSTASHSQPSFAPPEVLEYSSPTLKKAIKRKAPALKKSQATKKISQSVDLEASRKEDSLKSTEIEKKTSKAEQKSRNKADTEVAKKKPNQNKKNPPKLNQLHNQDEGAAHSPDANVEEESSIRRSKRQRVDRLRFWDNEKIVYKLQMTDSGRVPVISEVIRVPEKRKRSTSKPKSKPESKKAEPKITQGRAYHQLCSRSPILKESFVLPSRSRVDSNDTVAYAWPGDKLVPNNQDDLGFDYQESGCQPGGIATSGILEIHPGETCALDTLPLTGGAICYVIYGHISVTLNKSKFNLSPGCQLHVPPTSSCSLSNLSSQEGVRLFVVNPGAI